MLKQSTARNKIVFMTESIDHITGATGLTLIINASMNGGTFSTITPTVTELANGWYSLALTTTHTATLGDLALHITATGADPTDVQWEVFNDLPGASVASVTARVTANADQWAGGTIPAPNITGVPLIDEKYLLGTIISTPATSGILDVNIKAIANSTSAATNLAVGANSAIIGTASGTPTTTTMPTNLTNTGTDIYKGRTIIWTSGVLTGEAQSITAYNGSTKTLTFNTTTSAPSSGDTFAIY